MTAPQVGDTVEFEHLHGVTWTGTVMAEEWVGLSRWLEVEVDGGFYRYPAPRFRLTTAAAAGSSPTDFAPVGEVPAGLDHLVTQATTRQAAAEHAADAALAFVEAFRAAGLDVVSMTALVEAVNAWEAAR